MERASAETFIVKGAAMQLQDCGTYFYIVFDKLPYKMINVCISFLQIGIDFLNEYVSKNFWVELFKVFLLFFYESFSFVLK